MVLFLLLPRLFSPLPHSQDETKPTEEARQKLLKSELQMRQLEKINQDLREKVEESRETPVELVRHYHETATAHSTLLPKFVELDIAREAAQSENVLDNPLSAEHSTNHILRINDHEKFFADGSISFNVCSRCKIPRVDSVPVLLDTGNQDGGSKPSLASELRPLFSLTQCCVQAVCANCFLSTVIDEIGKRWLFNLRSTHWLPCPGPDCSRCLPISSSHELAAVLRALKDDKVEDHVRIFETYTEIRRILCDTPQDFNTKGLELAAKLHHQLSKPGHFHPCDILHGLPLDIRFLLVREAGSTNALEVPLLRRMMLRTRPALTEPRDRRPGRRHRKACTDKYADVASMAS